MTTDAYGGQPAVHLANTAGDRATVLLHGGHVVRWATAGPDGVLVERLYLSPTTALGDGAAIRGGVPVVFPQFNQRGPDTGLPKHGFARNRVWSVAKGSPGAQPGDRTLLELKDDAATRAIWPHAFTLRYEVALEPGALSMTLEVTNTGAAPFHFTAALHTYLAVDDVTAATVEGLAGASCLDTVVNRTGVAGAVPLAFAGETDNIYWNAPSPLTLRASRGDLRVAMTGFQDVVVWNPWADKARALPDMPDDDWRRMVCIEAARIGRPVTLEPAARWTASQLLSARPR